jgi:hypothetical protein
MAFSDLQFDVPSMGTERLFSKEHRPPKLKNSSILSIPSRKSECFSCNHESENCSNSTPSEVSQTKAKQTA